MTARLLFITSHYFCQPTRDALQRLQLPCHTMVVPYTSFQDIGSVYQQYISQFDACFVSGTSAKKAIQLACPSAGLKPLVAFQVDADALHRDILRLAVEKQSLDFSRIAIDFMVPLGHGCLVSDYLALDDPADVIPKTNSWIQSAQDHSEQDVERYILSNIQSLWQEGKIDLVICQYSSLIPAMEAMGIPCRCPFLSDRDLKQQIDKTLMKLELIRLHDNHPAIVQIFPQQPQTQASGAQFRDICRKLHTYIRDNLLDCVLQESKDCCVIITSMQILRFLTNDFQICRISAHLEEVLGFPVTVGYGVGTNVTHAMNNVQVASKEAKLTGKSFIVDSNGNLIGPLNSETRMVIASESFVNVSDIAKRCSLSALTIQKLIAITQSSGTNRITTQELALKLNTTVRNANRILQNLCRGNVAKPVYAQTSHSRGRPVQVYSLDFGNIQP